MVMRFVCVRLGIDLLLFNCLYQISNIQIIKFTLILPVLAIFNLSTTGPLNRFVATKTTYLLIELFWLVDESFNI